MPQREKKPRIAVLLHLYYPELWPEMAARIAHISEPLDLIASLPSKTALKQMHGEIRSKYPGARLGSIPNMGRDIGPLIRALNNGLLDPYALVCKIHTKRSTYSERGTEWRNMLLDGVLGSTESVKEIIAAFDRRPQLGIVGPGHAFVQAEEHWGGNRPRVEALATRMGWKDLEVPLAFFAGSMFWFRPAALAPLRSLDLRMSDFEPEQGQQDCTLAHSLERLMVISSWCAGFEAATADALSSRVQDGNHRSLIPVLENKDAGRSD